MKGALGPMGSLARNHPVAFVLTSAVAWSVLLVVLMGVDSSALRRPYGDATIGAIGRLAVTACVWFSLPLGTLGILMLVRAGPDRVLCEHP